MFLASEIMSESGDLIVWLLGLGTKLGTFKGTDRIASVLQSIDSH